MPLTRTGVKEDEEGRACGGKWVSRAERRVGERCPAPILRSSFLAVRYYVVRPFVLACSLLSGLLRSPPFDKVCADGQRRKMGRAILIPAPGLAWILGPGCYESVTGNAAGAMDGERGVFDGDEIEEDDVAECTRMCVAKLSARESGRR